MSTWCILLGSPQTRSLMSWAVSEVHCDCVTSFMFPMFYTSYTASTRRRCWGCSRAVCWGAKCSRTQNNKNKPFIGANTRGKQKTLQRRKNTDQKLKTPIFHGSGFYYGCLNLDLETLYLEVPSTPLHTPFNTPPHLPFPPSFRPELSYAWIGHRWFRCSLCLLLVWRPHGLPITPWGNMEYCRKSHRAHTNASLYRIDLICTSITEPGIDGLPFWSQFDWGLMSADAASRV